LVKVDALRFVHHADEALELWEQVRAVGPADWILSFTVCHQGVKQVIDSHIHAEQVYFHRLSKQIHATAVRPHSQ
jgi:hypothetical protein